MILHRDQAGEEENSTYSNNGKLIVAKNRFGVTGIVPIRFNGNYAQFNEKTENYDILKFIKKQILLCIL